MSEYDDESEQINCITVLDLAKFRGVKEDETGGITMGAFEDVGLPFFGGCQHCSAQIAPYNACPTKNGLLTCLDCVREEDGFETVEEANRAIFPGEYAWLGVNRVADKTEPDQMEYDSTDYDKEPDDYESTDYPNIACDDE
jgi:hypothetical protein